jgi:hypothetical protein
LPSLCSPNRYLSCWPCWTNFRRNEFCAIR